jgi:hypothetical protein
MYPVLVAAAAVPVAAWLAGHRRRQVTAVALLVVNAVFDALLFLPVLPVTAQRNSVLLAVNSDAGETIGWPQFVRQVAAARARYAPDAPILTANYGEAAAIQRFGSLYHLPTPHSGHNSYWWWGPPPGDVPVVTVGLPANSIAKLCTESLPIGRIDNGLGIRDHEQHAPMYVCVPRASWSMLWPHMKSLG